MFYYLFGWEMRHLHTEGSCPVVSGQGVCDYDQFWSLAGWAEAMPNFLFCYVTSNKNQPFCAPGGVDATQRPVLSHFSIDYCQNAFPDPAGGLTAPPTPPAGKGWFTHP